MNTYNYRGIITTFENIAYSIQVAKLGYGEEEGQEFRIIDNRKGDWGDIYPLTIISKQTYPLPVRLNLRWITLADLICYESKDKLDTAKIEAIWKEQEQLFPDHPFKYVVVGIAPYGGVAIWLRSRINAVFVQQLTAREVEFNDQEKPIYTDMNAYEDVMLSMFPKDRLNRVMAQYTYRYVVLEEYFNGERWALYDSEDEYYENIDIEGVEDQRLDGTFDFTDGDSLLKYHDAGIPKRVTVRWTENGSRYFAHFWLDTHYSSLYFESFHHNFPDTRIDLLVRLDTRANRYEVMMSAEDFTPRAFIGTQYIVFKDFKEINRSEYFTKSDGEWDWE